MPVAVFDREALGEAPNPLGMDGIEYVEYSTKQPQALGQVLEAMGFKAVARHRSREVLLYRQGGMNVVVNAHAGVLRSTLATDDGAPRISALAFRVRDARAAHERALALGAWEVAMHAHVMELNIPGIHGPGGAHIYFVDRYRDFSIYSVDFTPIPGADPQPEGTAGLHWFGIVQYIGSERTDDWVEFYHRLFGFVRLPQDTSFGILPKGTLLQSPQGGATGFYLQLIEPDRATVVYDEQELFHRIGFGTPDVPAAVAVLRGAGVDFIDTPPVRVTERGAITRNALRSVVFELVHDPRR
ncbi:4-hydroxyphenylpyruvate dioxygenase [Rubrivivax sp. A210]|uniref:4-hydroxyphenylpyruvate dioxygenase n=1 Tax=Rubrivivax sp. A210 TaxID=2772301 RepID=UPI00191B5099|nr:4-hydroxyphenylpyruvate dioxygenase [Rubrivivax sp. A210]CAD5375117.1 4-hydroxyphenylpyruvate dioxygenase [Rubrivivax sp. A210]